MKPGIKTTELWVTIITVLTSFIGLLQGVIPEDSIWAIIVGTFATALGYISSRTVVKKKEAEKPKE